MEERNLDKAVEILTRLMNGEDIGKNSHTNVALYEEYSTNAEVYDILNRMLKGMNIKLYEYNDGLYITAGDNNQVFGFTNKDIRNELGLKVNRELYLCYFIIYQIITCFYSDSSGYNFTEYIKLEDIMAAVDISLKHITDNIELLANNEMEENSFRTIAFMWNDLPAATEENVRATKNSKAGYIKITLNFLISQKIMAQAEERYYLKDRGKALIENYFEEHKGRLYEILQGKEEENATH